MNLRGEWTRVVFEELYYTANNQKIADKKKADYQEALEKSHADSAARSRDSYMKDLEKKVWTRELKRRVNACSIRGVVLWGKQSEDSWQKKADYQEALENSRADSAARSRDRYMKDTEKSCAQSHDKVIIMKYLEKSRADTAAWSREIYEKDLEKNR